MNKLNAKQLRVLKTGRKLERQEGNDIYIVLDNVLDTYNIGSAFRLADAAGAKQLLLCGGTSTPPDHKIKKASINTTEIVEWVYFEDALQAIKALRKDVPGIKIVAVEQSSNSSLYSQYEYSFPLALIVGHESEGVSTEAMQASDAVVELPMFGANVSLNVVVSLGIVLYKALEKNT